MPEEDTYADVGKARGLELTTMPGHRPGCAYCGHRHSIHSSCRSHASNCTGCGADQGDIPPFTTANIRLRIRMDISAILGRVRSFDRRFRKLRRLMQQEEPERTAMHADYARRRKARTRRQ